MIGAGDGSRVAWWRDIAFYGAIPALGAWIGLECALDTKTLASVALACLVGMKAKMSNGKPGAHEEPQPVVIENLPNNPAQVEVIEGDK